MLARAHHLSRSHLPRARLALAAAALLVLAAALPAQAQPQRLPALLPADTFLAAGAVGLERHADLLEPLVAEWERLGLTELLERAFGGLAGGALPGDPRDGELAVFDGLDILDLVGREAWIALSISPFNPLPALTLLASVDEHVAARFDAALDEAAARPEALSLSEGGVRFVVVPQEEGLVLAAARAGDLLALSTNPDVLRSVLRQAAGSAEPTFGDSEAYRATVGALGEGELFGYLDLPRVTTALTPLLRGFGFDRSIERLAQALQTAGTSAGVLRVTPDGVEGEGVRLLRGDGRDLALYTLLARSEPAPRELLALVPATALAASVSADDPGAWWDYLVDLVAGLPELALPDLDRTLRDLTGADLRRDLFSWTGPGVVTVTTGIAEAVQPGIASEALLGENVVGLTARDEEAARVGLRRLFETLGATISLFTDPLARGGPVPQRERSVAGVPTVSYDLFPGLSVSVAVTSGVALIGTSEAGFDAALVALLAGGELPETLERLLAEVPAAATGFSVSDDRASLLGTAGGLSTQLQLLAGLGGAAALDFDAVLAASDALEVFLVRFAERLGGTVSWTIVDGAIVRTLSRSEIDWR
jgi:hypothetical protein